VKRTKPIKFSFVLMSALLLSAGCATKTAVVERKSAFGGMSDGRPAIEVQIRNDGLYYDGGKYTRERVVKRILADEVRNNTPTKDRRIDNSGVLLRPVKLVEKGDLPDGYVEDLRRYFIANKIPGVVIQRKKEAYSVITD